MPQSFSENTSAWGASTATFEQSLQALLTVDVQLGHEVCVDFVTVPRFQVFAQFHRLDELEHLLYQVNVASFQDAPQRCLAIGGNLRDEIVKSFTCLKALV